MSVFKLDVVLTARPVRAIDGDEEEVGVTVDEIDVDDDVEAPVEAIDRDEEEVEALEEPDGDVVVAPSA